jgi:type I restriction enzyme M protein
MANVSAVISNIRNIMRQDRGISGDAQRLEQLGWMLFLKIMDDKDQELEVIKDNYVSVIPEKFQWRNWATNPEGITGDELINFIDSNELANKGLFLSLREIKSTTNPKRAMIVKEVFDGTNNYMKSGYEMRKVINKLNEIDFTKSEDKHVFGNIYESILQELRDAGNKGEYYTPRAVTQLMTMMTDPKLGEKVLDPAAGTGGFLSAAIDHVRDAYVKTVDDEAILQNSITGWELKPVAYVLGLTNLILHEIDVPDYHYIDSLKKEYNSIGKKDQVDVILANPPFGASIADGVETNFPATYRCKESADLFVILMLQLLKPSGRCAIVLPDGSITGDGIKARIREKLLTDCNLHTIIRLPQSTFFPALVYTNLLFFEKGSPTNEIWYYEHKLPIGQKSYSKTKPIQFNEFEPIINWWHNREENAFSWKVNIEQLTNFDLDVKNPNEVISKLESSDKIYETYSKINSNTHFLISEIVEEIFIETNKTVDKIIDENINVFKNQESVNHFRLGILRDGIKGNLTTKWRELNPKTASANGLFKSIKAEKNKLIEIGKIKKGKALPAIKSNEIPYEIPPTWTWCRLGDIIELVMGQSPDGDTYNKNGVGMPFYQGKTEFGAIYPTKVSVWCTEPKRISQPNDILISVRAPVGDVNISDKSYSIGRGLSIMRIINSTINHFFLFYYFDCVKRDWNEKGSFFGAINRDVIENKLFALPPIEEQNEIVRKVELLMNKCNQLSQEIEQLKKHEKDLLKAMFNETFETNAEIIQE